MIEEVVDGFRAKCDECGVLGAKHANVKGVTVGEPIDGWVFRRTESLLPWRRHWNTLCPVCAFDDFTRAALAYNGNSLDVLEAEFVRTASNTTQLRAIVWMFAKINNINPAEPHTWLGPWLTAVSFAADVAVQLERRGLRKWDFDAKAGVIRAQDRVFAIGELAKHVWSGGVPHRETYRALLKWFRECDEAHRAGTAASGA